MSLPTYAKQNEDKIKELFKNAKIPLSEKELKDIYLRAISKPFILYSEAINFIKKHNEKDLSYQAVKDLIKLDIRIRDNLKKIITAIEEGIRTEYFMDNLKDGDSSAICLQKYKKTMKEKLATIIQKQEKNKAKSLVKKIRNKVSHIHYFLIFREYQQLRKWILQLKKMSIIQIKILDKYIEEISNSSKGLKIPWVKEIIKI